MQKIAVDQLRIAAQLLLEGKLVAFPTETVYGLGAVIFDSNAMRSLFVAKRRPRENPLIVHISTIAQVEELAIDIPRSFYLFAEKLFPGPLTLIMRKHPRVPFVATGGLDTVALRMPGLLLARSLIDLVGHPLVAPSANLSGRPSATCPEHVIHDFAGKIAGVVMGGPTELGIESTVLSLVHSPPLLLRPGNVTRREIEKILGEAIQVAEKNAPSASLSPGMRYRHYAPSIPLRLFYGEDALQLYLEEQGPLRCMVLSDCGHLSLPEGAEFFPLNARDLYAFYRLSEARGDREILIYLADPDRLDPALKDRIMRSYGCDITT